MSSREFFVVVNTLRLARMSNTGLSILAWTYMTDLKLGKMKDQSSGIVLKFRLSYSFPLSPSFDFVGVHCISVLLSERKMVPKVERKQGHLVASPT